jgi:hypothetical protein
LADGLSNQFLVGEKHIPQNRFEKCEDVSNDVDKQNTADCSYLQTGNWRTSAGRGFLLRIENGVTDRAVLASGPNDFTDDSFDPAFSYGFGSWHTGVCNFVLGDGSVRAVNAATPFNVLYAYATVNDGESVSLP